NDTLTGGDPDYADTFVFARGWGQDTITDFGVGKDHLDMRGVSGLTGFNQLTILDSAQGAKIILGADMITLNGVTKAHLTAASFMFASAGAGSVSISDATVVEGTGGTAHAVFTVSRTGGTGAFDVNFTTVDISATTSDGDYVSKSGPLHFVDGQFSQEISIDI